MGSPDNMINVEASFASKLSFSPSFLNHTIVLALIFPHSIKMNHLIDIKLYCSFWVWGSSILELDSASTLSNV